MEKQETIFIKGMQFYKPRENAPEFIKGNIVVQKSEFIEFLKTCNTETVRIDLKKSKEKGTLYLTLNTFNPVKKEEPKDVYNFSEVPKIEEDTVSSIDDINPDDIPF